jgi:DNA-binding NarL/FixJ family response regulator
VDIVFADDSYLIREAVSHVLGGLDDTRLVAVCEDGDELRRAVEDHRPDVVITDVRMPPSGDGEGIDIARWLRHSHPNIGVVVLSQYAEPRFGLELIESGAAGRAYLLKDRLHDARELLAAIHAVASGGSMIDAEFVRELITAQAAREASPIGALTVREREVLHEVARGRTNRAIAESLVLSRGAVEKHVGAIFQKLGLLDENVVSRRVVATLMYLADEHDGRQR